MDEIIKKQFFVKNTEKLPHFFVSLIEYFPHYYYKKDDSYLEEDFFVRTKDYLVPVEVKATNGTAKSLRTLLKSNSYPDIKYGIKFTAGNIGYSDNIYTFPYFCAFLLKNYLQEVNLEREDRK